MALFKYKKVKAPLRGTDLNNVPRERANTYEKY
jgi:hypothetical protein